MTDLKLKDINQYYGTMGYHQVTMIPTNATDGVKYVVDNGYHWFVSDMEVVAYSKFQSEEFLVYNLVVDLENNTAVATIEDGNENVLYKQEYDYTTAKVKELKIYKQNGVMMLPREY